MPISDYVLDNGLASLAGANRRMDITKSLATTYAEATTDASYTRLPLQASQQAHQTLAALPWLNGTSPGSAAMLRPAPNLGQSPWASGTPSPSPPIPQQAQAWGLQQLGSSTPLLSMTSALAAQPQMPSALARQMFSPFQTTLQAHLPWGRSQQTF